MTIFNNSHYDAVIVGARCAGAATAMLLARQGARVLIVDRSREIGDTLSTHILMRPAVAMLHRWGLLDRIIEADTPLVQRTQFHYESQVLDIPIKPADGLDGLYSPRRWLLDRVLCDAAEEAGAELHTGVSCDSVLRDATGRVVGISLRSSDGEAHAVSADIVIGADGRQSIVAREVGAKVIASSDDRSATYYGYFDGIPNEGYRWYYGKGIAAGLVPTTNGAHCLFTSCLPEELQTRFGSEPLAGMTTMLAHWDAPLAAELAERGPIDRLRRYPGAPGHILACSGDGWALVGDAGYFKDPASAHGITDAFLDADRLSRALGRTPGNASSYQVERDRFAPELFRITQRMASLKWEIPELQALHMQLNACMKHEAAALEGPSVRESIAA
jgi:2-polyprenyl-6-methoxyphenol hydroxylase-like FAD-dependent oxidoreductase